MKISIIIPAYNEGATLQNVIERVKAVTWGDITPEIIIVNDGSTDDTRNILAAFEENYRVIHHAKNSGKSAAIRSGLVHATGEYTIIQDGDMECDPQDIKKILDRALATGESAVYGSRRLNDGLVARGNGVWYYNLGGVYLTTLTNLLYGTSISDEPVAYKLIRTDILKSFDLKAEGFGFCPEVTAKLAKRGIPIREVAISYYPRSVQEGKKIRLKDAIAATGILIKHRFVA